MEEFREMIGRIGIFVVCAQAMIHFRPREVYAKYLRLLLGLMVLVQIFQPLYSLFWGREGREFQDSLAYFQESLEEGMKVAAQKGEESEDLLEETSLKMLNEQMEAAEETAGTSGESGDEGADVEAAAVAAVEIVPIEVKMSDEDAQAQSEVSP